MYVLSLYVPFPCLSQHLKLTICVRFLTIAIEASYSANDEICNDAKHLERLLEDETKPRARIMYGFTSLMCF